jgi:hypothetical protein
MITRDDIRGLAEFQSGDDSNSAVSFYFQPAKPHNRSHREGSILAKDVVRNALREAGEDGKQDVKNEGARTDLRRMLELASSWQGTQSRAKAVFACSSRNFWREFDLPAQLAGTQIFVNRRFHLKPLMVLLGTHPRLGVAVFDRRRARFFDLHFDELTEREGLFHSLARRGRGDGFAGYDGGHAQRRVNDEALHHFKNLAAHLKQAQEKGNFDYLVIGSSESNWHELQPHLHPNVAKAVLGHFPVNVAGVSHDQLCAQAERTLRKSLDQRRDQVMKQVLSQAKGNHRGVTGLRRVLRSLEMGEVQTLLL